MEPLVFNSRRARKRARRAVSSAALKSEVDVYYKMVINKSEAEKDQIEKDPYSWWAGQSNLPFLKEMAKRRLSIIGRVDS